MPGGLGNMLACLLSLFVPGMGQFFQGRLFAAFLHLFGTMMMWAVMLGWIGHIGSAVDAARWRA